jgi:hypothetical protein
VAAADIMALHLKKTPTKTIPAPAAVWVAAAAAAMAARAGKVAPPIPKPFRAASKAVGNKCSVLSAKLFWSTYASYLINFIS